MSATSEVAACLEECRRVVGGSKVLPLLHAQHGKANSACPEGALPLGSKS